MADLVEFVAGDADTTVWGRKRATLMNHSRPYNLSWVEIGARPQTTFLFMHTPLPLSLSVAVALKMSCHWS